MSLLFRPTAGGDLANYSVVGSATASSNTDTLKVTGLDLSTHKQYKILYNLRAVDASPTYALGVNGTYDLGSYRSRYESVRDGKTNHVSGATDGLVVADMRTNGGSAHGFAALMDDIDGRARGYTLTGADDGASRQIYNAAGYETSATGNVTELAIRSFGLSTTLLEGFESGDLSAYGGDTGAFTVDTNAPVRSGSYALTASATDTDYAINDTGVTTQQGEDYEFYCYPDASNATGQWQFGVQSEAGASSVSCFQVAVNKNKGQIHIERKDSGSYNNLAQSTKTIATGEWGKGEVSWASDGTISFTYTDSNGSATVSYTDTTYTSGGYGFNIFDGTMHWDDISHTTGTGAVTQIKAGSQVHVLGVVP